MIVFDLRCGDGHVFEAWFASSPAYAEQRERGLIGCPVCGATEIDKAVMAPNVAVTRQNAAARAPVTPRAILAHIAAMQAKALKDSRWVGRRFADEARAMHDGDTPQAVIHGQATPAEAEALREDGIAALPLLVPVTPPEALN